MRREDLLRLVPAALACVFAVERTARDFAHSLRTRYPGEGQLHLYEVSTDTPDLRRDISRTV